MKFILETAGVFYSEEKAAPLRELGLKFRSAGETERPFGEWCRLRDDWDTGEELPPAYIEVDDMEALWALSIRFNCSLVISFDPPKIVLYDDYLE